jgi:hypothetical protein
MPNIHGTGGLYFYSQRIIDAFTLQGPDLTGTCSGHWLYGRSTESPPFIGGLAPSPVAAISLSCTLQLGQGAPAETELVIALVNDSNSPSRHLTGAYGPGPSVLAGISPLSEGTADVYTEVYGTGNLIEYRFVGDIVFGGRVFQGVAGGSYSYHGEPAPSFSLTGTSPTGDLSASCVNTVNSALFFAVGYIDTGLVCTGSVGSGPASTVRLLVETPLMTTSHGGGRYSTSDYAGAFFEFPVALPS